MVAATESKELASSNYKQEAERDLNVGEDFYCQSLPQWHPSSNKTTPTALHKQCHNWELSAQMSESMGGGNGGRHQRTRDKRTQEEFTCLVQKRTQ